MLLSRSFFFFFNDTATTEIYTLSLHDALPIWRRAVTFARRISEVAAWAGVHGRGEHEARGKRHADGRAGDGHVTVFERLAQHFEHVALKFRQFVEKEHAIVPERDLAWARHRAAAYQTGVADRMVRRTEGPRTDETTPVLERARHAVNARRFDGFFERHWREGRWNGFCEQWLPPARGRHSKRVVAGPARGV